MAGQWHKKVESKRVLKRQRAQSNSTRGKDKGPQCMAGPLDRFCAKYSRAVKHPYYPIWCEKNR